MTSTPGMLWVWSRVHPPSRGRNSVLGLCPPWWRRNGSIRRSAPVGVVARWPEVVIASDGPAKAGRVQAWVAGPGAGTDAPARQRLVEVLQSEELVVVDADGLTLISADQGLRDMVGARHAEGRVTVITPHAGEFSRLGFELPPDSHADRLGAVKARRHRWVQSFCSRARDCRCRPWWCSLH